MGATEPVMLGTDPVSALAELAALLVPDAAPVRRDEAARAAAAAASLTPRGWPRAVEVLADGLGLCVRTGVAPLVAATQQAVPELPVVVFVDGAFIVIDDRRSARVRVRRAPGPTVPTWEPLTSLPAEAMAVTWVEPTLPLTALKSPPSDDHHHLPPLQRVAKLVALERADLKLLVAFSLIAGVLGLAIPVAVQVLVNTVAFGAFRQPVVVLSLLLLAALVVAAALRGAQRWIAERIQRRIMVRLIADLANRLTIAERRALAGGRGPELLNRFHDVVTVKKAVSGLLLDSLQAVVTAVVGLALLAVYHPYLLGFDVFVILAAGGVLFSLGRNAVPTAVKESHAKYEIAEWLEAIAGDADNFKLNGQDALAVVRADALSHRWLDRREAHFRIFFRQYVGALGLQAVANVLLLGVGGWLVIDGQLGLGQLAAAELVVATMLGAFAKLADKLESFYDLVAAADKLGAVLDVPTEEDGGEEPPSEGPLAIRLEGVGVGSRAIDLDLHPGARVLVQGGTAGQRRGFADVLLGLTSPPSGRVLVGDVDARRLRRRAIRRRVALLREGPVPPGTLEEVVRAGRDGITPNAVRAVLDAVGLGDRVASLPEREATRLAADGAPLSPPERAALLAARALAGRPDLIVVDGLLDELSEPERATLVRALTDPVVTSTLVVLAGCPVAIPGNVRKLTLDAGGAP